jgi:hypothetical protein
VLDAVAIVSPTQYTLAGNAREVAAPPDGCAVGDVPLVEALQNEMYTALYCRWTNAGGRRGNELADRDLVLALAQANTGHGTWEPGWKICGPDEDGRLPVAKDGLTLWVQPDQVRNRSHSRRLGTPCRVRIGKELRELSQGFYFAIGDGDELDSRDDDERMVRLYWHIEREGAVELIRTITSTLNPLRIPFRAKVVNFVAGFPRSDAGVLYLDRRYYPRAAAVLPQIHEALRPRLAEAVPLFTRTLAHGLGLAEDPQSDESFGQHRCRVVAEAMWRAFADGATGAARLDHVARAFADLGFDPERLYLQPGSGDDYSGLDGAVPATPIRTAAAIPARRVRDRDELRARRKQERQSRKANRRR